jgi:outer membrane protein OmpA-like peptidoglycan-associated protein
MNFHQLNVPIYIDTLCGVFNSGNSILPSGFLLYERPLGAPASSLWIAPRLHLSGLGALIATPANEQAQARDISQPDSPLVNTNRVFHLSSSILSLGADLFVKYPLTSRLFLMGGPSLSYLIRRDANVTEIITSPSNAVFGSTGQSTRTVPSQQTPGGQILNGNSILATFTLGATLDIPVSTKVVLAPELLVTIPFNSLRQDYSWRVTTVSAGIALKFNIAKEPKLEVVKIEPEAPKGEIHASVQISGVQVDSLGREHEIPQPQLRVEEYVRREAYPQLNYIFFDEDSSQIPPRYHLFTSDSMAPFEREPAASFDPSRLSGRSALDIYHETLNILGHRLQQNPSTDVTLTGTNEGTGIEANAPALSKARADRVKQYLVNTWKIDPSRITVQAVNLPTNASSTDTKEGAEENRRVEITSSDPSLLDPLVITDTDRTMNPPKIRVRTTSTSKFALNQTSLVLRQGSRVLLGTNSSNTVQDWTPSANELPRTDTPLVATLDLRDSIGTQLEVQDSARVTQLTIQKKREERVRDTIIEHYNLITFDFDKAELGPRSERIVQEIARNVTGKDAITLRGYTDMTGDRQHNLTLSETRAANVEAALKQAVGEKANTVKFSEQGEGEINLVDNRLPEGRFLSRTVFVQVTRPVE